MTFAARRNRLERRAYQAYNSGCMSLGEIEAELDNLTTDELRRLALKSWAAFVEKDGADSTHVCDEDNPTLLAALDEALAMANSTPGKGRSGDEVRAELRQWL
jgi:hypothetical protein